MNEVPSLDKLLQKPMLFGVQVKHQRGFLWTDEPEERLWGEAFLSQHPWAPVPIARLSDLAYIVVRSQGRGPHRSEEMRCTGKGLEQR